jgi:hypothetical protein
MTPKEWWATNGCLTQAEFLEQLIGQPQRWAAGARAVLEGGRGRTPRRSLDRLTYRDILRTAWITRLCPNRATGQLQPTDQLSHTFPEPRQLRHFTQVHSILSFM